MENVKRIIIRDVDKFDFKSITPDIQEIIVNRVFNVKYINTIIEYLKKNNIKAKIVCELPVNLLRREVFAKIIDKDIVFFSSLNSLLSIDDMLAKEQKLDDLIKNIKDSSMSPYEKFIAIYYFVIHFKQYKEESIASLESRSIYAILDNDYIVCTGFVVLLIELLKKVGINAKQIGVVMHNLPHARCLVKLEDDKYNINGFFFCDPTKDEHYLRGKPFFKLAKNMNLSIDEHSKDIQIDDLIADGLFVSMSDEELYNYIKSLTFYHSQMQIFDEIDPLFVQEVGLFQRDFAYAVRLNKYLKRKMNVRIPLIIQYKALMEVIQFSEARRYSPSEYNDKLREITNGDMRYIFEVALLYSQSSPNQDELNEFNINEFDIESDKYESKK